MQSSCGVEFLFLFFIKSKISAAPRKLYSTLVPSVDKLYFISRAPDPTMQISWRKQLKQPQLPLYLSRATGCSPPLHTTLMQQLIRKETQLYVMLTVCLVFNRLSFLYWTYFFVGLI